MKRSCKPKKNKWERKSKIGWGKKKRKAPGRGMKKYEYDWDKIGSNDLGVDELRKGGIVSGRRPSKPKKKIFINVGDISVTGEDKIVYVIRERGSRYDVVDEYWRLLRGKGIVESKDRIDIVRTKEDIKHILSGALVYVIPETPEDVSLAEFARDRGNVKVHSFDIFSEEWKLI